ncbi:hypothetical protein ACLOJK_006584 [Asimina triloba]
MGNCRLWIVMLKMLAAVETTCPARIYDAALFVVSSFGCGFFGQLVDAAAIIRNLHGRLVLAGCVVRCCWLLGEWDDGEFWSAEEGNAGRHLQVGVDADLERVRDLLPDQDGMLMDADRCCGWWPRSVTGFDLVDHRFGLPWELLGEMVEHRIMVLRRPM